MKTLRRIASLAAAVLASVLLISCENERTETGSMGQIQEADAALHIRGAGATFPAPLYEKWIEVYQKNHSQARFSYDAVGSGEGIKRFISESVDFGASDAAMNDSEIVQVKRGVRLIPVTAGMVALAYNIWGLEGELKLGRDVCADIFLGKIKRWNDPKIQASNPNLSLPDMDIAPVARLDSSGTTYAFTNHLSAISDYWRDDGPGVSKQIDWPARTMQVTGNEGVAQRIKISEGSIGYVEYGFAKRLGLPMAWLQNRAGKFVKPEAQTGEHALDSSAGNFPANLRLFIPDPAGASSYPIVSYSWLLLYDTYADASKAEALKKAIRWGLTEGQKYAEDLGYIPLPQSVVKRAEKVLAWVH